MPINNKCFCGSNKNFSSCCHPFINRDDFPQTPEKLMRSRFSAYVSGNSEYIYDTYAKSSQTSQSINDINEWGNACSWLALQIHPTSMNCNIGDDTTEQFVEFSAFYISDDILYELRENSRFMLEDIQINNKKNMQWRYIDGDIINHSELFKIKRKDLCPCNLYPTAWSLKRGKKFKQCCANL
jgi:SEC-C motif-containing protein